MQIVENILGDVLLLACKRHQDNRGFFSEVYSKPALSAVGVDVEFVQDNHSLSAERGVVRGLHYQLPPAAQAKLIRVVRGSILDVVLDLRKSSPTFGRSFRTTLSRENWLQIFIPVGFAHGFVTLERDTEVAYKVSAPYAPQHERGIRWNDPDLKLDWGIEDGAAIVSPRDERHPLWNDAQDFFP